jgi:nitroreductase
MELSEVINKRRTIRDFSDKKVPYHIIEMALEAGLKAPSYNHQKQWDFILINDINIRYKLTQTEKMVEEVTKELEDNLKDYEALTKEMYLDAIPKQKRMILEAPELLVVVFKPKTQIKESVKVYDLNCLASVWCCIENILLTFADHEIYGVTFISQNTSEIKQILGVPEDLEVAALIPFGYQKEGIRVFPQKDTDVDKKLHRNQW